MKAGDLVQTNLFDKNGSGGYGLIIRRSDQPSCWEIKWCYKPEDVDYYYSKVVTMPEKTLVVKYSS